MYKRMTLRNRIGSIFAVSTVMLSVWITPVLAQSFGDTLGDGLSKAAPPALRTSTELPDIIGGLIGSVIAILGAVLFIYLLWGGYKYMTAAGEREKVQEAKDTIKNAVIGIVIVALSFALSTFIINELSDATSKAGPTDQVKEGS